MKQSLIGKRIRLYLNSVHGFSTLTGILMGVEDGFFLLDTYKGLEHVNTGFIISFMEVMEAE